MRAMWYARDGSPLRNLQQVEALLSDNTYKVIKQETVRGGRKLVSTVWLGLDFNHGEGDPLIFETMVFCKSGASIDYSEIACRRYATEAMAHEGHRTMVRKWQYNRYQRRRKERLGL